MSLLTKINYISIIGNNQSKDVFMRFDSNSSSNVIYFTFSNIIQNIMETTLLYNGNLCLNLSYFCMNTK